jgi:hypothetical protein
MSRKTRPTKEFLEDLKAVFEKHNWSGNALALQPLATAASGSDCPAGKTPHEVTYQLPNGSWVTKTICL